MCLCTLNLSEQYEVCAVMLKASKLSEAYDEDKLNRFVGVEPLDWKPHRSRATDGRQPIQ